MGQGTSSIVWFNIHLLCFLISQDLNNVSVSICYPWCYLCIKHVLEKNRIKENLFNIHMEEKIAFLKYGFNLKHIDLVNTILSVVVN